MDKEDQSSKLDKLKFAIKVTAEVTKEASKAILNMGKDIASVFGETVGGTIGKLSKILGDTIAKQSKNWSQSIKQLGSVAKNIGGVINGIGSSIINMAKGGVEQVLKIGNSFESFSGKMNMIDQGVNTLGQSLVAALESPLNEMADFGIDAIAKLQESFNSGGNEAMLETGSSLLNQMMEGIVAALPNVIDTVGEILTMVCQTISQLAPQLSETGFEIISQLLLGIMENMPMLAETALTLILSLVNGLAAQLPVLLPAALDMIMTLIEGLISNLPKNAVVEVPCLVDTSGVTPTYIGELPEQLAALNRTNINTQLLTIEAALTQKKDKIYQAAMLDPHTASELSIEDIISLCDDLIEVHGAWLPAYE